jgi:predicted kinase
MEIIVFCGLQASGKTSYYVQNFLNTHARVSLDLLNTRNKEKKYLDFYLSMQQKIVVDNTNPTKAIRKKYLDAALAKKYKTICYYFKSTVDESIARNNQRQGKSKVSEVAIKSTKKQFEIPGPIERFQEIWEISLQPDGTFKNQKLFTTYYV